MRRTDELSHADRRHSRFTRWHVFYGGAIVVGAVGGTALSDHLHDDLPDRPPPVTSELDTAVERYAEMSPFLRQQLADLRADGWTIGYGAITSRGTTRADSKTIVIADSLKEDPFAATSVLAHEVGHAYPGRVDFADSQPLPEDDYDSWLDRNMRRRRLSEADAELIAARARWEIMVNGGPDIGGVEDNAVRLYLATSADMMSREDAREKMLENPDWYSFDRYRSKYENIWDTEYADTHGPSVERLPRAGSATTPKIFPHDPAESLPSTTDQ